MNIIQGLKAASDSGTEQEASAPVTPSGAVTPSEAVTPPSTDFGFAAQDQPKIRVSVHNFTRPLKKHRGKKDPSLASSSVRY